MVLINLIYLGKKCWRTKFFVLVCSHTIDIMIISSLYYRRFMKMKSLVVLNILQAISRWPCQEYQNFVHTSNYNSFFKSFIPALHPFAFNRKNFSSFMYLVRYLLDTINIKAHIYDDVFNLPSFVLYNGARVYKLKHFVKDVAVHREATNSIKMVQNLKIKFWFYERKFLWNELHFHINITSLGTFMSMISIIVPFFNKRNKWHYLLEIYLYIM